MMTKEDVIEALQDRNLRKVSEATGLHYATVKRVADNKEERVAYGTIKSLSDYFTRTPKKPTDESTLPGADEGE